MKNKRNQNVKHTFLYTYIYFKYFFLLLSATYLLKSKTVFLGHSKNILETFLSKMKSLIHTFQTAI